MIDGDRPRPQRLFWSIVVAYAASWIVIAWLTSPSLDPYGDMVENYAWSQSPAWGTFKHPPLFAWMVGGWFALFPTTPLAYYVLSYLNAAAGALGIVALARLWLPEGVSTGRRDAASVIVLLLAVLSLPYANLAAKFNADTVLLSLWPWTAVAFFASVRTADGRRRAGYAVLFGAMAAASMLGKYFSVILLATLFIVSLSHRVYRRWYATPQPYIALAVMGILLLPHIRWEVRQHLPFQTYLETKIDDRIDPVRIVVFLLSGVYYLPASWLAFFGLRQRLRARAPEREEFALPVRGLVLTTILPALLTAASNVAARIHLTTHWAIPVWFGLPVLMTWWLLPRLRDDFEWPPLTRALVVTWCVLLAGAVLYAVVLAATGDPKYALGRAAMVDTVVKRFAARAPSQQLAWAGGSWPESGALAFFASNHPRALPGLPDEWRAQVNPYPEWRSTYGVILCYPSGDYARQGSRDEPCERETRNWLRAHRRPIDEETLTYRAQGWRFVNAPQKNVTVFWISPATAS